jgi:hypothetical protein
MKVLRFCSLLAFCISLHACQQHELLYYQYEQHIENNEQNKNPFSGNGDPCQEVFIVKYFQHAPLIEAMMDSFIVSRLSKMISPCETFHLEYYKYSKTTNLEYLKKHPNIFYEPNWLTGEKSSAMKDYLWEYSYSKSEDKISKYKTKSSRVNQEIKTFYYPAPSILQKAD